MAEMTVAPVATHGFFLDGKWLEEGDIVDIRAPYDGSVIASVHQGRREHAEAAIAASVKAFGTTRRLPAFERQRVLRRIADAFTIAKMNLPERCHRRPASPSKARAWRSTAPPSPSASRPRRRSAAT